MARQTLVLLPGLLNSRRVFEHQIADLADIADAIVPELWHHDSIGAMAQATLDAAPKRFALGGFSMGGYVCFEILRRAPERVERLALMDTQAAPDTPEASARRRGFIEQSKLMGDALCRANRCSSLLRLPKHSHMSEVYAINTADKSLSDRIVTFVSGGR